MAKLDTATAAAIVRDVADGVPIASSALTYGPEETRFRELVEIEWAAWCKEHPGAYLEPPLTVVY
jgi:hypothetical protein